MPPRERSAQRRQGAAGAVLPDRPRAVPGLWSLDGSAYRVWLRTSAAAPGVAAAAGRAGATARGTVLWIHGARGSPAQFAPFVAALEHRVGVAAFVYDDRARLRAAADALAGALAVLPAPLLVVANSLGTLLLGWVGARDRAGRFARIGAVYLNPLIGGSRYADADPLLAVLGELPGLRWLHGVKRGLQRALFPPVVRDLTPESAFQQAIFGRGSAIASFAARSRVLVTDRARDLSDLRPGRVLRHFGRSRAALLERLGRRVAVAPGVPAGHDAPLRHVGPTLEVIAEVLGVLAGEGGPQRRVLL